MQRGAARPNAQQCPTENKESQKEDGGTFQRSSPWMTIRRHRRATPNRCSDHSNRDFFPMESTRKS
jgi:hypothetical protein